MTKIHTNTFTGGMNTDTDATMLRHDQYRHGLNIRVSSEQGHNGCLQNIPDTQLIGLSEYYKNFDFNVEQEDIVEIITVDKYIIMLTATKKGAASHVNKIYRITGYDPKKINNDNESIVYDYDLQFTCILKGNLGIYAGDEVKILANYESDTNVKLYIADGKNPLKVLNIMDDKYVQKPGIVNPNLDSDGNIKDVNLIDITPSSTLYPAVNIGIGSGSLPVGMVQYAYQLFTSKGSYTSISTCSQLIHLTDSDIHTTIQKYKGADKNKNSGKSVKLKIKLDIDGAVNYASFYDSCRIYRIHYKDKTELPTVEIISELNIKNNSSQIVYEDNGLRALSSITIDEFNAISNNNFIPATIEKKDNRLYAANIKDNTWDIEYDARAYRFNKHGRVILQSANQTDSIDTVADDYNSLQAFYSSVPKDHDCINPYNTLKETPTDETDFQYSSYKYNGNRVLGGSGPNISYRFIYEQIPLDTLTKVTTLIGGGAAYAEEPLSITTPKQPYSTRQYSFIEGDSAGYKDMQDTDTVRKSFMEPFTASDAIGYQKDEVYRFGIVFKNKKNISSPVHWIADIRMPHPKTFDTFYTDNHIHGRSLGIKFEVNNLPEDVVAYEIVRCERTIDDRTVLFQGVLSGITQFKHKFIPKGDELGNEKDHRPMIPLSYTKTDRTNLHVSEGNVIGGAKSEMRGQYMSDKYSVLISPEIDIMGSELDKYMSNTYLDHLYYVNSRFISDENNVRDFITPKYTMESYTSTRMPSDKRIGSRMPGQGFIVSVTNVPNTTNLIDKTVSNLLSKRYLIHHKSNNVKQSRITTDIEDTIFPDILVQNDMENKIKFYKSIGDISYINIGVSFNKEEGHSRANKGGYFGKCAVIKGDFNPELTTAAINLDTLSASNTVKQNIQGDTYSDFTLPVVNVKRNVIPYGGNTYLSRSNSVYISIGSYSTAQNGSSFTFTFGGDTYLGIHDHKTNSVFPYIPDVPGASLEAQKGLQMSCTDYIPFESSVNLNLLHGQSTHRSVEGLDEFMDPYLATTIDGGNLGSYHTQLKPYYAYNDAYSCQPTVKKYVPKYYDEPEISNTNRILVSEAKTNNEVTDSWTVFKFANYLDVDNKYGKITNLYSFMDKLYFWQDDAFGVASVNERSLITDNNIGSLTLGTGGILSRYDYITTSNGSFNVNDKSITNSDSALYWLDVKRKEHMQLSDSLHTLSKEKDVNAFIREACDYDNSVRFAVYDKRNNELQTLLPNGKLFVYSEGIGQYISVYEPTVFPTNFDGIQYANLFYAFSFPERVIYTKVCYTGIGPEFKLGFAAQFNAMSNKGYPDYISNIIFYVNSNPELEKVYDNVFFNCAFHGGDPNTDIRSNIIRIDFNNIERNMRAEPFKDDIVLEDGFPLYPAPKYQISKRENTYRFAIGRNIDPLNPYIYDFNYRIRGKALQCDYIILNRDHNIFSIPSINTIYRQSLV